MTEIKNLTETDTVYPNNLFIIYDGIRVRSVEAKTVKDFCAQNGIGTDEAFIAGRIANNILFMTRATGEEVAIGDLETFDLSEHTISELGNVPPLEADKFLKVSSDGQSIEYSVSDPAGDEIGVEDSGSALGKAQNLNFGDQLEVTLNGNTATIDGTVVPSGYKNLKILSAGDDPKTLDTGICYVSGQFVGAPIFPTSDYQGFLIKQKLLQEGEDPSTDTDYQLIIYYSIYGTYLLPKYAGTWWPTDDWFTMLTHNTKQEISADKTFKANSHLGFNRQSDDLEDAYKLIADANAFFIRAFSNIHGTEVDSIKIDQNGAVSFPNTWNILKTDQPANQSEPQAITAEKRFIDSNRLGFVKGKNAHYFHTYDDESGRFTITANWNFPDPTQWREAIQINNYANVSFPNTPNIVLTDKEQTISSNKTFQSLINMDLYAQQWWKPKKSGMTGGFRMVTNYDSRPGFLTDNLDFIAWVPSQNKFTTAMVVTDRGTTWINAYRSFATITADNFDNALAFKDPRYSESEDLRPYSYIEKIQIKVIEPFDTPLNIAFECGRARNALFESKELSLHEKGVIDVPIAELLENEIQPSLRLLSHTRSKPTKGKAFAYLIVH